MREVSKLSPILLSLNGRMEKTEAVFLTLVPLGFFIAAAAILFIVLYFRNRAKQFRHLERMSAIEKGIELPPEPVTTLGRQAYLLRGLVWLAVGIGITIFFVAMRAATGTREVGAVATLGIIPFGVGVAHLIVYRAQGR